MTTLVTGATGGVGRNAVERLSADGHPMRATGRNRRIGDQLAGQGVDFVKLDLVSATQADLQRLLDGIETVWHCAAFASPWGPAPAFDAINITATKRLAEAAMTAGVRHFVHLSTPAIYFDYHHRLAIRETSRARHFACAYARSKWQGEQALRHIAAGSRTTTFIILRPRALFGRHDRVLLPRLLARIKAGHGHLWLPRGGATLMDLTYIPNLIDAMHLASRAGPEYSGNAYNISNQEPRKLADIVTRLCRLLALPLQLHAIPYPLLAGLAGMAEWSGHLRRREPPVTRYTAGLLQYDMTLDNGRAIDELGYRPRTALDEALRQTADGWRSC